MIKILAIGNSFSQDSTTYLYQMAQNAGVELKVVNLYIGGCCLERHWNNIIDDKADYDYQLNGTSTGRYAGIKEVLMEEEWDVVTMQQCSGYSGILESYYPYITNLSKYINEYVPNAKQFIHQTWAYEIDSDHGHFSYYNKSQDDMYKKLVDCYHIVARELSIDIIPFGDVIQKLRMTQPFDYSNGGISLCRDGFHMSYTYGRYALAATWYEYIIKGNILDNTFVPTVEEKVNPEKEILNVIKHCVHEVVGTKL
jgi:hypothetical protein